MLGWADDVTLRVALSFAIAHGSIWSSMLSIFHAEESAKNTHLMA